jgi:hypothetical protein
MSIRPAADSRRNSKKHADSSSSGPVWTRRSLHVLAKADRRGDAKRTPGRGKAILMRIARKSSRDFPHYPVEWIQFIRANEKAGTKR